MNCKNEFICPNSDYIHYRLLKMQINCATQKHYIYGSFLDYLEIDKKCTIGSTKKHKICIIGSEFSLLWILMLQHYVGFRPTMSQRQGVTGLLLQISFFQSSSFLPLIHILKQKKTGRWKQKHFCGE